jgi:hypothetical protein
MSAFIVRGHTASPLNTIYRETRAMEQVPVVVAVTTNVPVPTVALRAMRDILMHTIVATLGIELPSPDLVRDPVRAELESHQ